MIIQDPRAIPFPQNKTKIIYTYFQDGGKDKKNLDTLRAFKDECFVLSDGVRTLPNAQKISLLAAETAIWAYQLVRQRPYYWDDKKLFMKRIFRSTNLRIWQKRKDSGFEAGSATSLLVCMIGKNRIWAGNIGASSLYIVQKGFVTRITNEDVDANGVVTRALGFQRSGLVPQFIRRSVNKKDTVLLVNRNISQYVDDETIRKIITKTNDTVVSLDFAIKTLFEKARRNGSADYLSAWLIKRVGAKERSG